MYYLREDVYKTNQGGLNSRKKKPKEVLHYANTTNQGALFTYTKYIILDALLIGLTI